MFRITFLIFVLMSSLVFAQEQENSKPKTYKFDEFGKLSNQEFNERFTKFWENLYDEKSSPMAGYIINYGRREEITKVEKMISYHPIINRRIAFNIPRIVIVNGGIRKTLKTEFWIVPPGADPPNVINNEESDLLPKATNFAAFGNVTSGDIKALIDGFFLELQNDSTAQGYIVNSGINKEVLRRERFLRNYFAMRRYDLSRISFITKVNTGEIKTELWIVPTGAALPDLLENKKATKFNEFGYVSNGNVRYFMDIFFQELFSNADSKGYIINYGKPSEIVQRERILRNRINLRRFNASRIKFVRGGNKKEFITELWIVPQGAEPPTPEK